MPPALSVEPEPTRALVVTLRTDTTALRVIAAVPPKEPPAETDAMSSVEVAEMTMSPRALITTLLPTVASVSLVSTSTSTPAPTPAVPPRARAPAMPVRTVPSCALTTTPWVAPASTVLRLTLALSSMWAVVEWSKTPIVAEPATPAVPPPEPAIASRNSRSSWVAATVVPVPPNSALAATSA